MTNEEIDKTIASAERKLWTSVFLAPILSWILTGFFALGTIFSDANTFPLIAGVAGIFGLVSAGGTAANARDFKLREKSRAREIWEQLGYSRAFAETLSPATRQLGNSVQLVYLGDPAGKLFPLRQSVRLLDTHHRQQQRLALVETRLGELRSLQESLAGKMAQLQALGEDYPEGARDLAQINQDAEALRLVHGQIYASCTRLEAIVISVYKAVQARELRRELGGLSARVKPASGDIEPAFEAESLGDIERQIGREIETYLRLERETDEHLR